MDVSRMSFSWPVLVGGGSLVAFTTMSLWALRARKAAAAPAPEFLDKGTMTEAVLTSKATPPRNLKRPSYFIDAAAARNARHHHGSKVSPRRSGPGISSTPMPASRTTRSPPQSTNAASKTPSLSSRGSSGYGSINEQPTSQKQLGTEAGSRMAFITPMRKAGSPSSSSSSAGSSASSRLSPILKRFSPNNGASPVLGNSSRASSSTCSEKSHDSGKTNDKIVSGSNASMSSRKRVNFIQRNIQLCNPASRRGASVRKS